MLRLPALLILDYHSSTHFPPPPYHLILAIGGEALNIFAVSAPPPHSAVRRLRVLRCFSSVGLHVLFSASLRNLGRESNVFPFEAGRRGEKYLFFVGCSLQTLKLYMLFSSGAFARPEYLHLGALHIVLFHRLFSSSHKTTWVERAPCCCGEKEAVKSAVRWWWFAWVDSGREGRGILKRSSFGLACR